MDLSPPGATNPGPGTARTDVCDLLEGDSTTRPRQDEQAGGRAAPCHCARFMSVFKILGVFETASLRRDAEDAHKGRASAQAGARAEHGPGIGAQGASPPARTPALCSVVLVVHVRVVLCGACVSLTWELRARARAPTSLGCSAYQVRSIKW